MTRTGSVLRELVDQALGSGGDREPLSKGVPAAARGPAEGASGAENGELGQQVHRIFNGGNISTVV